MDVKKSTKFITSTKSPAPGLHADSAAADSATAVANSAADADSAAAADPAAATNSATAADCAIAANASRSSKRTLSGFASSQYDPPRRVGRTA